MKIIHSYWFKPFFDSTGSRNLGGFPETRYFWYSWGLSFFSLYERYSKFELVTDKIGKELALDILGLPYSNVSTDLENLSYDTHHCWNYGKFIAYLQQEEPFLHIDTDAMLFNHIPPHLFSARIFGQSFEGSISEREFYAKALRTMRINLGEMPKTLEELPEDLRGVRILNCGVFGGIDIESIHAYAKECLRIIDSPDNLAAWSRIDSNEAFPLKSSDCSVALEQILISQFCQAKGFIPEVLFDPTIADPRYYQELAYQHLMAGAKSHLPTISVLENEIKARYPQYYNRVNDHLS